MTYRRSPGHVISNGALAALARLGRYHPRARPEAHGVEILRDLPYRPGNRRDHQLDVYRPALRPGPWPVVFYVHGGAFSLLSKDTHWLMGLAFARHGYLVVNVSYRLAPEHPFPAAIADVCAAWAWTAAHVEALGGDLGRIAVAGESAGGNLITALTVATTMRRPEPWARQAFDTGVAPRAALPFCALLEVSNPARFARERAATGKALPRWIHGMLHNCSVCYLQDRDHGPTRDLADPLCLFERAGGGAIRFDRPLPPFFAAVGTRDPLLPDTRRLAAALARLGVPVEAHYYPGGIHAFHALLWQKSARRCWRDALAFLDRHLRAERAGDRVRLALPAAAS
jgi:acetyl esterase